MQLYPVNQLQQRQDAPAATVRAIPIENIAPSPYQPRRTFRSESLDELAASLDQVGLLQPITVRCSAPRRFELIAGERRLRAAQRLGWTHIDALVLDVSDQDAALLTVIENLQRENLHFFEEAEGYLCLIRDHGLTQEQVARRVGKRQSTIANKLRLLRLPPALRAMVVASQLTERHARAVLRLGDEESQTLLLRRASEQGWTVRRLEQEVERQLENRLPSRTSPMQKVVRLMRDSRIFVNAVKRTVDEIQSVGIDARMTRREEGADIVLEIRIPRLG
nr:ParB/RepB/Spo0J family partition protein [Maliibacterium massiliense]